MWQRSWSGALQGSEEPDAAGVEFGHAPPCSSYMQLRPIHVMDTIVEKYHTCTQPEHLKDSSAESDSCVCVGAWGLTVECKK